MPVTCRDIITRGLRKAKVYAAGETPSDDDINDGMDELQNLYEQWISNGMFGRLSDVLTDADYIELIYDLIQAKQNKCAKLLSYLKEGYLLFLGCNFPDWFFRFFIFGFSIAVCISVFAKP